MALPILWEQGECLTYVSVAVVCMGSGVGCLDQGLEGCGGVMSV